MAEFKVNAMRDTSSGREIVLISAVAEANLVSVAFYMEIAQAEAFARLIQSTITDFKRTIITAQTIPRRPQ